MAIPQTGVSRKKKCLKENAGRRRRGGKGELWGREKRSDRMLKKHVSVNQRIRKVTRKRSERGGWELNQASGKKKTVKYASGGQERWRDRKCVVMGGSRRAKERETGLRISFVRGGQTWCYENIKPTVVFQKSLIGTLADG